MKAQDLKNSVLQLATQGKLVEQNSNDEPASVLLEKIKAEKEKLIKEKKIKREKPLPEISEEEKHFEIPQSWEWVRLGELSDIYSGNSINKNIKEKKYMGIKEGYPYIATKDVDSVNESIDYNNGVRIPYTEEKFRVAKSESILICAEGGSAGKKIGLLNKDVCFGNKLINFNGFIQEINKYIYYLFQSVEFYQQFVADMTGIIGGISINKFKNLPIALPPLEEQKRIVAKIEEVLEKIEEYDNAEKELSELEKAFPQDMKKSILQYAIQGKLVEQNSNDEPASILLEKIKAEKEQLIKEKKIKKEKPLPEISEEEKPFDIPDSWEWVRLSDCVKNIKGVTFKKNEVRQEKKEGYDFILRGGNINPQTGEIELIDNIYIPKGIIKDEQYIEVGDTLMVASSGTKSSIAKSTYIDKVINDTSVGAFLFIIRPYESMCSKYINLVIRYIRQKIINTTSGTNISNVSKGSLDSMVIPLPPLEEQKRIVDKVEKLLNYVDRLQNRIDNQNLINKIVKAKSIDISESKELINN